MSSTPKSVIQTVVIVLGAVTLALIAGAFVLIALDHPVPDPVWTLAGVGVGAFGSLLASTRTTEPEVTRNVPDGAAVDTAASPVAQVPPRRTSDGSGLPGAP